MPFKEHFDEGVFAGHRPPVAKLKRAMRPLVHCCPPSRDALLEDVRQPEGRLGVATGGDELERKPARGGAGGEVHGGQRLGGVCGGQARCERRRTADPIRKGCALGASQPRERRSSTTDRAPAETPARKHSHSRAFSSWTHLSRAPLGSRCFGFHLPYRSSRSEVARKSARAKRYGLKLGADDGRREWIVPSKARHLSRGRHPVQ